MESLIQETRRKEAALQRAMLAGDVDALDALISDHLCFVGPDGSLLDKRSDLEAHRTRLLRLTRLELSGLRLMDLGSSVVAMVCGEVEGFYDTAPIAGRYRYTRVWHGTPGELKLIAGHCSEMA